MLSVTTGFALAALGLPENFEHYLNLVKALEIPAFIIFSGKTALAWPLCYHSFNGIRHLVCITNQNSGLHGQPPRGLLKLNTTILIVFCLFVWFYFSGMGSWFWLWHEYSLQDRLVCVYWFHGCCCCSGLFPVNQTWILQLDKIQGSRGVLRYT